jgi:hypothetical protein
MEFGGIVLTKASLVRAGIFLLIGGPLLAWGGVYLNEKERVRKYGKEELD